MGTKARIAKAPIEEPVNAVAGGGFAAETSGDDVELILVDKICDTGESNTSYFGRSVEEIGCDVFEAQEFPEILTADRVKLL